MILNEAIEVECIHEQNHEIVYEFNNILLTFRVFNNHCTPLSKKLLGEEKRISSGKSI